MDVITTAVLLLIAVTVLPLLFTLVATFFIFTGPPDLHDIEINAEQKRKE
jgi:hypothetical protein